MHAWNDWIQHYKLVRYFILIRIISTISWNSYTFRIYLMIIMSEVFLMMWMSGWNIHMYICRSVCGWQSLKTSPRFVHYSLITVTFIIHRIHYGILKKIMVLKRYIKDSKRGKKWNFRFMLDHIPRHLSKNHKFRNVPR